MCLNWITTDKGLVRPCHVCWQCKRDHLKDWVGRCIAESKMNAHTLVGCLTYGSDERYDSADHPHAHILLYSDVQKYWKLLRKYTGGQVRFFVAGEYGSKKGRAHWHVIAFCRNALPPNIEYWQRYIHCNEKGGKLWPHGWSYWEPSAPENIRYVVKYLDKVPTDDQHSLFRFSKCPGLGFEYFSVLACQAVEQGLPPRIEYRFANDWKRDGTLREYRMSRAGLFHYLASYDLEWQRLHGNESWPQSELMEAYVDERDRLARRGVRLGDSGWDDYVRKFDLQRLEVTPQWVTMTDGDGRGVQLYPLSQESIDRYRRASRGE